VIEQRSDEWFAQRAGKFTGSTFNDLFAVSKKDGKPLKGYTDLLWRVATERFTGEVSEGATGSALQWGTDIEPYAKESYEFETGNLVVDVGFVTHSKYNFCGASPDGIIGDDHGVEFKCPKNSSIHLSRFLTLEIPDEYVAQVQGCMWVTERSTWDFVSYDPRMPESHRILIIPAKRDPAFIARLESAVLTAEEEVKKLVDKLHSSTTRINQHLE
jgi:putative phage-type endonuclease